MKISQVGINLICSFEGLVLHSYRDAVNVLTIGYGSTGSHVKEGMTITKAEAEALLRKDLERFEKGVNDLVKVKISQSQFDSLTSFCFNLGVGSLKSSTLLKKLNAGDYIGASNEFTRWNKAGGKVLAGLTRRREAEKALFLKADPAPKPAPAVKPAQYPLPMGVLKLGSNGQAVKELQNALNKLGFKCGTADGDFGAKTKEALFRFQSVYCNPADGIYGTKTRSAMLKLLK